MAAVLVVEWMTLSVLYDAEPLGRFWPGLGYLGLAGPLLVVIAGALVILGGRTLKEALLETALPPSRGQLVGLVALHVVSSAAAVKMLADLSARTDAAPAALVVGVLVSTVSSVGSLVVVAFPPRAVGPLVRRAGGLLAVAALVGVAAFAAGLATEQTWDSLADATLELVVRMLRVLTDDVVYAPEERVVGTGVFWVVIAPVCSGYEGIGLIAVFVSGYLWLARDDLHFPRALWLLPIAVAAVFIANSLRITALIAVGSWIDPYLALDAFHSKAGWLLFAAVALGVVWASRRWSWMTVRASESAGTENPTAAFVLPLLAVLATGLVTTAFASDVDLLYPLRIAVGLGALLVFRRRLGGYLREPLDDESSEGQTRGGIVDPLSVGLGLLVGIAWVALADGAASTGGPTALDDLSAPARATWIAIRVAGSVLLIPIVEELAFRGYLLRRLFDADFTRVSPGRFGWLSLVVSSVAFGALHQSLFLGTLVGAAFALAQYRRARIGDAVIAHAVANAVVAAFALASGADTFSS